MPAETPSPINISFWPEQAVQCGGPEAGKEASGWVTHGTPGSLHTGRSIHVSVPPALSQHCMGNSSTRRSAPNLGWRDRQHNLELCRLCAPQGRARFPPFSSLIPVGQEVPPWVAALWGRTCWHGAGQGGGGLCVCMCVCVCVHCLSQKNLLLVWNSSHITSAETGVRQRQPRDDKSPERLQRGFWTSTSGIPRSISFQVKRKTMTVFFCVLDN